MIGGVGIILTGVGVDYIKERPWMAGSSTAVGFTTYLPTDNLVRVIIGAVVVGSLVDRFLPDRLRPGTKDEGTEPSGG
ncbi:MAG: hypothetical protein H0V12_10920 [Chloroflexi bacterium]|nr:hypothetical protein [Chloroflexota bacterium]